jgi:hypothetical protein
MTSMKKVLLGVTVLVLLAGGVIAAKIGPRNIIGMIRYDQRQEGTLQVGDAAPQALLVSLDGKTSQPLLAQREKPTVLIFGSFT